jgi:hypothetical protein
MATKINIIRTKDKVYATYVKTICYKESYDNEDEMWDILNNAKATAFNYGLGFGGVILSNIYKPEFETDDDIFEYLERTN